MSEAEKGLRLYNTLTRTKEDFVPIDRDNVRMYACGPTVYDFAHIGNARPVIVFDVLFRLLRHLYGADHVTYVRNITDVDDKINARAARDFPGLPLNEAIRKVTETTNAQFQADVKALGCLEPTFQPRATEHIDGMKAMVERLVAVGVAYVAEGHVLFSPKRMNAKVKSPRYGALARRSLDEMLAGARVDVASYKEDEMDFVLWKPSREGEPGWPSPAGIDGLGRPGWHIECSAMSMAKLLEPFGGGLQCDDPEKNVFDIHAGGIDLVFPHHENEIAQSCCAFGTERMANIWMHNGFLQVEGKKMSKSEGNFVTINELLNTDKFGGRKWPGEVLRLAMLMTHYREPIDFSVRKLEEAFSRLVKWKEFASLRTTAPYKDTLNEKVTEVLCDDLNLSAVFTLIDQVVDSEKPRESDRLAVSRVLARLGFKEPRNEFVAISAGLMSAVRGLSNRSSGNIENFISSALQRPTLRSGGLRPHSRALAAIVALQEWANEHVKSSLPTTGPFADELELLRDRLKPAHSEEDFRISREVQKRLALIAQKNWPEADKIRDELLAQGIQLKDGKDPATGERVTTWEVKR